MKNINCKQCGKEFIVNINSNRKFCNKQCYSHYQSKYLIGEKCNAYGHTLIHTEKTRQKIKNAWLEKRIKIQIYKNCKQCDKEFIVLPFAKKRQFCSAKCSRMYIKGKSYEELLGIQKAITLRLSQSNNRKGCNVWNKGLTKYNNIIMKNISEKVIENAKNNINFGMKGKHHTEETKKILKEKRVNRIYPLKDTLIEIKIQNFLKILKIEFYTHFCIKGLERNYQCDIFIPSMNLVIECDGDYWHGNLEFFQNLTLRQIKQREDDNIRRQQLIMKGYKVIQLWENEIKLMNINKFQNILVHNEKF